MTDKNKPPEGSSSNSAYSPIKASTSAEQAKFIASTSTSNSAYEPHPADTGYDQKAKSRSVVAKVNAQLDNSGSVVTTIDGSTGSSITPSPTSAKSGIKAPPASIGSANCTQEGKPVETRAQLVGKKSGNADTKPKQDKNKSETKRRLHPSKLPLLGPVLL